MNGLFLEIQLAFHSVMRKFNMGNHAFASYTKFVYHDMKVQRLKQQLQM